MSIDKLIQELSVLDFENFVEIDRTKPSLKLPYQIPVIAREITKGISDKRVKAYAIYNWVSENIEYNKIANENFNEECSITYSLKKKAGTCYSMTRLYVAFAKSVGLDARIVDVLVDRENRTIESPGHVCAMVDFVNSHQLYDPAYYDSDAKHKKIEYYSRKNTNKALIEDVLNPYRKALKIFEEKKDFKNIIKCCDTAISLFPTEDYFRHKKSIVLMESGVNNINKGKKELAIICFEELLRTDPNNPDVAKVLELAKSV